MKPSMVCATSAGKVFNTRILEGLDYKYHDLGIQDALFLQFQCLLENRSSDEYLGSKRDEQREWRRLPFQEPPSLYGSSDIVSMVKSKRLK